MNTTEVSVLRIYMTENSKEQDVVLHYLQDQVKMKGVTVCRGVYGSGASEMVRASSLLDLSLDLPIVIEFFDEASKVQSILQDLQTSVKPSHMIYWLAKTICLSASQ
jgi:PII-like signaling protein